MLVVILSLLSSVTVNEVPFDAGILDTVQDSWVASEYTVVDELIIDPLDYGTPQEDREGTPRIIGFQSFFVPTSDGEKWRIVFTYDRTVVVLQEDAEPREFQVERSIHYMINSKDGRYVLLRLQEEEDTRTEYERAISGMYYLPPENRSVLIDIDSGHQVTRSGIASIGYLGGNGYGVASYGDSIRFYDSNLNLVNQLFNRIANVSNGFTSYSSDGSLLVTFRSDTYEDLSNNAVLRAYDNSGNILWDTEPSDVGIPAVSADGSLVLVIARGRVLCLDGRDGSLLWEEPYENRTGICRAGRNSASVAFETDLTPEGIRENPGRQRALYTVVTATDGSSRFTRIPFHSESIEFFSCSTVNEFGSSLWLVYFCRSHGFDLSRYKLCLFSSRGELQFVHRINGDGYLRPAHGRNTMDLDYISINTQGNRIIWFEDSVVHILTLSRKYGGEGVSFFNENSGFTILCYVSSLINRGERPSLKVLYISTTGMQIAYSYSISMSHLEISFPIL